MIKRILRRFHIARESKVVIAIGLLLCILFCWVFPAQAFFFILIFISLLIFFRDPVRAIPDDLAAIVSPADGKIADINIITIPNFGRQPFCRIGIFLSIFNVHIQRFPYHGEIDKVKYTRGKFYAAFRKKAHEKNESNTIVVKTDRGTMVIKQIAGLIAKRIVCRVSAKKRIVKGEKLGMIMFGSRVELYIPAEIELLVRVGDKVIGGESVIAMVK